MMSIRYICYRRSCRDTFHYIKFDFDVRQSIGNGIKYQESYIFYWSAHAKAQENMAFGYRNISSIPTTKKQQQQQQ